MPHVKLRRDWNGNFRRHIRDANNKITGTLNFAKDEVVLLTPEECFAVKNDIGKALIPVVWSEPFRKFVPVDMSDIDTGKLVADDEPDDEETTESDNSEKLDALKSVMDRNKAKLAAALTSADSAAGGPSSSDPTSLEGNAAESGSSEGTDERTSDELPQGDDKPVKTPIAPKGKKAKADGKNAV